jgi:hypothetical protein
MRCIPGCNRFIFEIIGLLEAASKIASLPSARQLTPASRKGSFG